MKTAEKNNNATAKKPLQAKQQPFFNKEGQGSFFSKSNEVSTSFFNPETLQPKLTIGQPNDKYEVEADAMADQVVQKLSQSSNNTPTESSEIDNIQTKPAVATKIQTKCSTCEQEEKLQKKEEEVLGDDLEIQRKPIFESNTEQSDKDIQTKPLVPFIQTKCASCEQEEELQKEEDNIAPEEENIQTKSEGTLPQQPFDLQSRLNSSKGRGDSLSKDVQSSMGSAFGADFSNVRIHTGSESVQMNKELGAQAFTNGSDIYFNQGKYDTGSTAGKHLLAHELTHTIQQGESNKSSRKIQKQENTTTSVTNTVYIVENDIVPHQNQLTKREFLRILNRQVCDKVNEGLEGTPYTSETCPYLSRIFNRYQNSTPDRIQNVLFRYEREAENATSARQIIDIIAEKSKHVAANWAQTGDFEGIPPELASQIPSNLRQIARIGRLGNTIVSGIQNIGSTISSGVSSMLSVFFKANRGGARLTQSPEAIMTSLGSGEALNTKTRSKVERAYGTNFSGVEIHTDSNAAALNREMNSKAFTVGNHVAFGGGEYQPGTLVGDALIAHELAHVKQQEGAHVQTKQNTGNTNTNYLEEQADQSAYSAMLSMYGDGEKAALGNDTKTGLSVQRCCRFDPEAAHQRGQELLRESIGDHDTFRASSADRTSYDAAITELRMLFARKRTLVESGSANNTEIDQINAQISQGMDILRQLGVQIPETELMDLIGNSSADLSADTILDINGTISMQNLSGLPEGVTADQLPLGARTRFVANLNYVPPGHTATVVWMFEIGDNIYHLHDRNSYNNRELGSIGARDFTDLHRILNRGLQYELDEVGWLLIDREATGSGNHSINIYAYVYLDNQANYATRLSKNNIPIVINEPPETFDIQITNQRVVTGTHVEARIRNYAAPFDRYVLEWSYGQSDSFTVVARDALITKFPVSGTGERQLRVKAYPTTRQGQGVLAGNDPTAPPMYDNRRYRETTAVSTGETTFTIQAPSTAANAAMQDLLTVMPEDRYPSLAETSSSISSSITELRGRETSDAAHSDYYENRREAQEGRLERIQALAGDLSQVQRLPEDLSLAQPGIKYTRPVPAGLLVHQTGAFQPLNMYLTVQGTSINSWTARLLDVTGRDVYKFDGTGRTVAIAIQDAFSDWNSSENPYPLDCTVSHSYSPVGITLDNNFSTNNTWKSAKRWIDGILMVGGLLVAGFLILVPEPGSTATGIAMVVAIAGAVRGGIAIAENINIGIRATDSRNVLEAVGIVASVAGMGGAALRSAGLQAGRYATYRLGSGLVLSSLAGDVGTLAYASYEAIRMISAIQDDPTLGDSQKLNQILSLMGRLIAQGAIMVATNRDMFTGGGVRRSDFFRSEFRPGESIQVDAGSRLDMIDYMRRNDPDFDITRVRDLPPAQLVGEFRGVQDRVMSTNRLSGIMDETTMKGLTAPEIRALNQLNDETLSGLRNRSIEDIKGYARGIIDGDIQVGPTGGVRGRNVYELADPSDPTQRGIFSLTGDNTPNRFSPVGPTSADILTLLRVSGQPRHRFTIRPEMGNRMNGSTLSYTPPNPHYNLSVPISGSQVNVEVVIRAKGFNANGQPIPTTGGGAHGGEGGPASFTLQYIEPSGGNSGKWVATVEVDPGIRVDTAAGQTSRSADFDAAVGHELDKIADIVMRNHTNTGEIPGTTFNRDVLDQNIAEQQQASMFRSERPSENPPITSHDRAAAHELYTQYTQMSQSGLADGVRLNREARFNRLLQSMGFDDSIDITRFNQLMGALQSSGQNNPDFLVRVEAQWRFNVASQTLSGVPATSLLPNGQRVVSPKVIAHILEPRPGSSGDGASGGHETARLEALNTDTSSPYYVVMEGMIPLPGGGTARRYRQYELVSGVNKSLATPPTPVSGSPTPGTHATMGTMPPAVAGTHYDATQWQVVSLPKSTVDNMQPFLSQAERAFVDFYKTRIQGSSPSTAVADGKFFRHTFEGVTYAGHYNYDGTNINTLSVNSIFVDAFSIP